jgi:sugar phosphate isomerase/epimerase
MESRTLLLAHSCLRNTDFSERVAIALECGFNAIGLNAGSISNRVGEYQRLLDLGWTDETLTGTLRDAGIRIGELEALVIGNDLQAKTFERLAQKFEVTNIQTIAWFPSNDEGNELNVQEMIDWLRQFADRVIAFGTKIAIEFIPTTPIEDAATAQRLADLVDRPNVGTCVDFWHVMRGKGLSELRRVNWETVFNVQINDGQLIASDSDYIRDCLQNRQVPGDGEFPLDKLFSMVPTDAPINMEVMNIRLDTATFDERCEILSRGLRNSLGFC